MRTLLHLIEQYGIAVVFFNVLAKQLGAPLPAYLTLVITGAMLDSGTYSAPSLLMTAVMAAVLADFAWYLIGKRHGRRMLAMFCRISLSPDSCVRQTESIYARWGASSLLAAKLVPGFASISSVLAGIAGTRPATFVLFDGLGAAIWAGSAILLGAVFNTAIDDLLSVMEEMGKWGVLLLGAALAAFIAYKWWQRRSFLRSLHMARISVDELYQLRQQGISPVIIDVRSADLQQAGRIPGAMAIPHDGIETFMLDVSPDEEVILYCSCPNEASAAKVAKQLMQKGYKRVRPLAGGIEAWIAAGHVTEL